MNLGLEERDETLKAETETAEEEEEATESDEEKPQASVTIIVASCVAVGFRLCLICFTSVRYVLFSLVLLTFFQFL